MGSTTDLRNIQTTEGNAQNSWNFWFVVSLAVAAWVLPILWAPFYEQSDFTVLAWISSCRHSDAVPQRGDSTGKIRSFLGNPFPITGSITSWGHVVARIFQIDVLHAFQLIALTSLGILVVFAGLIGRRNFKSVPAGLLIGYLALVGVNPLGPAIAGAKHLIKDTAFWSEVSTEGPSQKYFCKSEDSRYIDGPTPATRHVCLE